jgi:hypothetical protein
MWNVQQSKTWNIMMVDGQIFLILIQEVYVENSNFGEQQF